MPNFAPGQIVQLKHDIGKQGIVTDAEPKVRAGTRIILQVNFLASGLKWIPSNELELAEQSLGPADHIRKGKFANLDDIRNQFIHYKMNGNMADLIYSMEATNTEFHAYQFKPVIKMLNSPSGSLFIADEVGLGKTIEAGLIWTELKARFDFNRLLVLCPNSLRYKWDAELTEKFGLDPHIVDAAELHFRLSKGSGLNRERTWIGGIQNLRPRRDWRDKPEESLIAADKLMRFLENETDGEPLFDLLIVDESHHLKNEESVQHELASLLRAISDQAVFLSATPIHLRSMDLFNQLRLLDPVQFQSFSEFEQIISANQPIQRAKDALMDPLTEPKEILRQLQTAGASPLLSSSRAVKTLIHKIETMADEGEFSHNFRAELASDLERANLLSNVLTRTRRRDVRDFRVVRQVGDFAVERTDIELELYQKVTDIVSRYATQKDINHLFLLSMPQRMLSSCMAAAVKHWREYALLRQIHDDADDIDVINDSGNDDSGILDWRDEEERPLTRLLGDETRDYDLSLLEEFDSKYEELRESLSEYRDLNEKVIIFSTFKSSLEYLHRRISNDGFESFIIHGGVVERNSVLQNFRNSENPSILLSSEVGSEGLDLQFCRVLFNYDLPWNPMRIEQRIGRIDRFGQKSDTVTIINFLHEGSIDQRIYERLFRRLNLISDTLGEFEAVLGEEIRKLTHKLILGEKTEEEQNQIIDQTALALEQRRLVEVELENEAAGLLAHGDYILQQVHAAQELNRWITDEDLENYLSGFLKRFYPQTLISVDLDDPKEFVIKIDSDLKTDLARYISENRKQGQTRLHEFGDHKCRFGKIIESTAGEKLEVINQVHPLFRFASQKFEETDSANVRPATAIRISASALSDNYNVGVGLYLIAVSKWSTSGTQRLEKMAYLMASLDTGEYWDADKAELITTELFYKGERLPKAEQIIDLPKVGEIADDMFGELLSEFDDFCELKKAENEDRAEYQLKTLEGHFQQQNGRIDELAERYRRTNNPGLRQVQLNKLENLRLHFGARRDQIKNSRDINTESEDVTAIIAQVV